MLTDSSNGAFRFVQALATELSQGRVDLPGFPTIVGRVRRVLADEDAPAGKVARVIGAEPVLAARLLSLANSAALIGTGAAATDLRTAITRVGLNNVRTATYAFAVKQLRQSEALRGLEQPVEALCRHTALVASLCYLIARKHTRVQPDTALLGGLLHSIGRLYILTRAASHRTLFADVTSYKAIERDWHLSVAVALLENWGVPEEIVHGVAECEDLAREPRGQPALADVLISAIVIAGNLELPAVLNSRLQSVKVVARLGLDADSVAKMMQESQQDLAELQQALG